MNTTPASESSATGTPASTEQKLVKLKSGLQVDINATQHSGKLTNVVHQKHGSEFVIVKIGGVTCLGKIAAIQVGAYYKLEGKFEQNVKFNSWDFRFKTHEVQIDASAGLRELLVREAPGIGPDKADKLVMAFRDDTMRVIREDPGRISQQLKMNIDACYALQEWAVGCVKNSVIKEKLYAIGLTPGLIERLLQHYGSDAEKQIRKDCFSLIGLPGIGFKTAANIADMLGIPKTDPHRLKAAIMYTVEKMIEQGSTCIPRTEVIREVCKATGVDQNPIEVQLDRLIESKLLLTEQTKAVQYCEAQGIVN